MIERHDRGEVAVLRLAHGKASAMDTPFCKALAEAFRTIEGEGKSLVLTGTGTIFSAGVDLKQLAAADDDEVCTFLRVLDDCFDALFRFTRPAVAALNGHAIAGGHVLAACCDFRIMAAGKGRIGVPELRVGVPFPPAALEATRSAVPGRDHAAAILLGTMLGVEEARERGWIDEIATADAVVDRAVAVAGEMASAPDVSFYLTKARLRADSFARIDRDRARFENDVTQAWCGEAVRSAIRRYLEATLAG